MADLGQLWFDMGVRDNTINGLKQAQTNIDKFLNVRREVNIDVKGLSGLDELSKKLDALNNNINKVSQSSNTNSVNNDKNANKELSNLIKIDNAIRRVENAKAKLSFRQGEGVTGINMDLAIKQLDDYLNKLRQVNASTVGKRDLNDITGGVTGVVSSSNMLASQQAKDNAKTLREQSDAAKQASQNQGTLGNSIEKTSTSFNSQSRVVSELRNQLLNYFSIYAAERFLGSIIQIGGEFEKQHIALQSILGDAAQADEVFSKIKGLAVQSPFQFKELTSYAKQLSAYSIPFEELYDTTKRLADISAGLGVDMSRIILAYGQVRSASVLRGQELRQFTEAGIPMVQALADKFTKLNGTLTTTGDVFKLISERQVSFDMVKEVLSDMTNEGGKFYNMQEKLADTLAGKWSNLKDSWDIMLADMAQSNNTILKGGIESITYLMRNWRTFADILIGVGASYAVIKSAIFFNNSLLKTNAEQSYVNIIAEKKKNAELLKRASIVRQLSVAEKQQIIMAKELTLSDLKSAIARGALNKTDVLRLLACKEITQAQAMELSTTLNLTKAEIAQAASMNKWIVGAKTLGAAIKTLGASFLALATNPMTWIFTAMSIGVSMVTEMNAKADALDETIKRISDNALERFSSIKEFINNINNNAPTNNDGYSSGITSIKGQLKEKDPNYGNTIKESEQIDDLVKRYEYLKDKLTDVANAYEFVSKNSQMFKDAMESTDGWFDDSLQENMADWDKQNSEVQSVMADVSKYRVYVTQAIENMKQSDKKLSEILNKPIMGDNGKERMQTLQEQINAIIKYKGNLVELYADIVRGNEKAAASVDEYDKAFFRLNNVWNSDIIPDLKDKYAKKLEDSLAGKGIDINNIKKGQEAIVRQCIEDAVSQMEKGSDEVKRRVKNQLIEVYFHLKPIIQIENENDPLSQYAQLMKDNLERLNNNSKYSSIKGKNLINDSDLKSINDASSGIETLDKKIENLESTVKTTKQYLDKNPTNVVIRTDFDKSNLELQRAKDLRDLLYSIINPHSGGGGGTKSDTWLKEWNARLELVKKFYTEYKKYADLVGETEAKTKLKESGAFDSLSKYGITDPTNQKGNLNILYKQIANAKSNLERSKAKKDLKVYMSLEVDYNLVKEKMDEAAKVAQKELDRMGKQWDMYKSWFDVTGDKKMSMDIAFGHGVSYKDQVEEMRSDLAKALKDDKRGFSIDEVLGWDADKISNTFGKDSAITKYVQSIKDETNKLKDDNLKSLLEILKNNRTFEQQLEDIERDRQKSIDKINANSEIPQSQKDVAIKAVNKEQDKKKSSVEFTQFKETSNWVAVFDDLDRMSTATINGMIDKINEFAKNEKLSVEDTKQLIQAMKKLREESIDRNPFKGFTDAISGIKKWKAIDKATPQGGSYTYGYSYNEKTNKIEKKTVSKEEINNNIQQEESKLTKSIKKIITKFDALAQAADMLGGLFEALGAGSGITDVANVASSGLNGAASGMSIASTLSENAGPWGAAAGAALSVATAICGLHDKAIDKEIEASKRRQEEMEDMSSKLKSTLERTLGGVFSFKSTSKDLQPLIDALSKNYTQKDTLKAIREALSNKNSDGSYYTAQYASLYAQRDELTHQRDEENRKKKTDKDKVADYNKQIEELNTTIETFATDMMKTLYSIDFKDWASQLGDALMDAWAKGEDAAQAYKDKAGQLMKDVVKNVLQQKALEKVLAAPIDAFTKLFADKKGVWDDELTSSLTGVLETGESAIDGVITGFNKAEEILNKKGLSMKDTTETKSQMTSAITNITENQADYLISYINAMRADVSVNRASLDRIVNENIPLFFNSLALQIASLKAIEANTKATADNTSRNANDVEEIKGYIKGFANGTKVVHIK